MSGSETTSVPFDRPQERIEYTPYGLSQFLTPAFGIRAASLFDIRYSYTGREWTPELAIYYFRNRWYSPGLGVFISRDPIAYVDGMSLYRGYFVTNGLDPLGESWRCCALYARYAALLTGCGAAIAGSVPVCGSVCIAAGAWTGGVACWACIAAAPAAVIGACESAVSAYDGWAAECL